MAEAGVKVIKAGQLIDGTGAAPVKDATVIIDNAKVQAVGQDIGLPKEAQVIDATGKTVMPGMIDAHMHFWGTKADDTYGEEISRPREVRLIKALLDAKDYLKAGFTTVKDCGGMNGVFLKQATKGGVLTGVPRIVASGYPLTTTIGNPYPYMPNEYIDARTSKHSGQQGCQTLICDGVDECIKAARYVLRQGADFVKIWSRGGSEFNPDELKIIVQTAAEIDKFVTIHCDNSRVAKNSILAGVKTVDHAVGIDDEAIEMGNKAGVIFVSTLICMQSLIEYGSEAISPLHGPEWARRMLDMMSQGYRRIRKSDGILAIGTDAGGEKLVQKLGSSAVEIELLVKYCDFTPMEAIVAATKNAALACFMGDKTGTIEPGKLADIIVVDGNPLADIKILQDAEKIEIVMLEGKVEIDR
jgi:imidazolonepropionase-like amidohydrolase